VKIIQVETLRLQEFPNVLWVEIRTDEGIVGLGETFLGSRAIEAYIHETAAPYLLGKDPLDIEGHAMALTGYVGYASSGAETRGRSAVNIALWDILGHATGRPLYQLLGGASRHEIPIYNTCAGYRYIREKPEQRVDNWGLGGAEGPYEDLDAFLDRADELAADLLGQDITAMKIWPFDPYAEASGGAYIAPGDLNRGLEPFRKIRRAVGPAMNVMVELHGLWSLPAAKRLVRALEEFEPFWFEDPIRPDNLDALAELARSTHVPLAVGETLSGCQAFHALLDRGAASIPIVDPSWVGGITEAQKVSALATTFNVPIAFHDCTGPVVLAVGTHLSIHAPTALLQKTVRAFYTSWYRELVTELPPIADGRIRALEGPGLGTALRPEVRQRPDATIVSSSAQD
jgi:L-alanine-DL-glutamate epimerase-like enolase superfamily enzyme